MVFQLGCTRILDNPPLVSIACLSRLEFLPQSTSQKLNPRLAIPGHSWVILDLFWIRLVITIAVHREPIVVFQSVGSYASRIRITYCKPLSDVAARRRSNIWSQDVSRKGYRYRAAIGHLFWESMNERCKQNNGERGKSSASRFRRYCGHCLIWEFDLPLNFRLSQNSYTAL